MPSGPPWGPGLLAPVRAADPKDILIGPQHRGPSGGRLRRGRGRVGQFSVELGLSAPEGAVPEEQAEDPATQEANRRGFGHCGRRDRELDAVIEEVAVRVEAECNVAAAGD